MLLLIFYDRLYLGKYCGIITLVARHRANKNFFHCLSLDCFSEVISAQKLRKESDMAQVIIGHQEIKPYQYLQVRKVGNGCYLVTVNSDTYPKHIVFQHDLSVS